MASFRRQESIFIALNLSILVVLFSLHLYFAYFWGRPVPLLVAAVMLGIALKVGEWIWLQRLFKPLKPSALAALTWASIVFNVVLATLLAVLTDKEDTPYFALMVVAVLEAAFRFDLFAIVGVVGVVDFSLFWQVWWFYKGHPPVDVGEYFEAGITSLLFATVGVLVWLLLRDLRRKELRLASNVLELEQAREQLLREEKLAVVGRLSSAIAHEIRNPVAMIASSIATAKQSSGTEREEMFEIASEEANRLSKLTTEFLDYASTRPPKMQEISLPDTIGYVADASRAHASSKGVHFTVSVPAGISVRADEGQLQQALMNLLLNAVDASPADGTIGVRVEDGNQGVRIHVENSGKVISEPALSRIFEPFFTTKPHGTGLGLAIARNIARAQGGDLVLSANDAGRICFSLILPGHQSKTKL
ncbi:MAG TPA: HAMP domain-containing sensor histidine kinase [Candidatus Sulfotelmatobacter sp.]|nr:HAMP domain-containing sensor histidine kinase [Candidatus Sulfotelmatobacter sp.]